MSQINGVKSEWESIINGKEKEAIRVAYWNLAHSNGAGAPSQGPQESVSLLRETLGAATAVPASATSVKAVDKPIGLI
jgi:hypothetical protein